MPSRVRRRQTFRPAALLRLADAGDAGKPSDPPSSPASMRGERPQTFQPADKPGPRGSQTSGNLPTRRVPRLQCAENARNLPTRRQTRTAGPESAGKPSNPPSSTREPAGGRRGRWQTFRPAEFPGFDGLESAGKPSDPPTNPDRGAPNLPGNLPTRRVPRLRCAENARKPSNPPTNPDRRARISRQTFQPAEFGQGAGWRTPCARQGKPRTMPTRPGVA